jgi:hypothetical protein
MTWMRNSSISPWSKKEAMISPPFGAAGGQGEGVVDVVADIGVDDYLFGKGGG